MEQPATHLGHLTDGPEPDQASGMDRTWEYCEELVGRAGDAMVRCDPEGRVIGWNLQAQSMFGYSRAEAVGYPMEQLILPREEQREWERLRGLLFDGETTAIGPFETARLRKDGSQIRVLLTFVPFRNRHREMVGYVGLYRDVTKQREAEERVTLCADLISQSKHAIIASNEDGTVVLWNPAAQDMFGHATCHVLGRPLEAYLPGDLTKRLPQLQDAAGRKEPATSECQWLRHDGRKLDLRLTTFPLRDATGGPRALAVVIKDISERKRLDAQLRISERLSALGEVLAGVAHELNNPLTVALGYAELLLASTPPSKLQKGLASIVAETRRCRRIVENLLAFALQRKPERVPTSMNDVIRSTLEMREYQLRVANARIQQDLRYDLPPVWADPHQLQQVLLNLLNNAAHAIAEGGRPGVIQVASRRSGDQAEIVISDNGVGMTEQTLSRCFDPFYTTKAPGEGTGLGLSLAYGIVHEHGGTIQVSSKRGEGCTFTIRLPSMPAKEPTPPPAAAEAEPDRFDGIRVLIVDDEPLIRGWLTEVVQGLGGTSESVEDGREALRKLSSRSYDLILCDLKMPEMSGPAFVREVQALYPPLLKKILLMTGDTLDGSTHAFLERTQTNYLRKPFDAADLAKTMRGFLERQEHEFPSNFPSGASGR